MSSPRSGFEGGVQPLTQVEFFPGAINDGRLLRNAARTALKFHRQKHALPFVNSYEDDPDDITLVNWAARQGLVSLREDEAAMESSTSFVSCVQRLISVSGIATPMYVGIMIEPEGIRPMHYDGFNGSRTLLLLDGVKKIVFDHDPILAHTEFFQEKGDAYKMHFAKDPVTDIMHSTEGYTDLQIAIYVQEQN